MTTTADNYLKQGAFAYEQDDDWAKAPAGYEFPEAAGVEVDKDDNVYVFNRGPHPVIVFDKAGNFVRTFGEDTFTAAPTASTSARPASAGWSTTRSTRPEVRPEGKLVLTLGKEGEPAREVERRAVQPPDQHRRLAQQRRASTSRTATATRACTATAPTASTSCPGAPSAPTRASSATRTTSSSTRTRTFYVADRENNRVQVFDNQGNVQAIWYDIYKADGLCRDKEGLLRRRAARDHDIELAGPPHQHPTADGERLARIGSPVQGDGPGEFIASTASPSTPKATSTSPRCPTRCAAAARTRRGPTRASGG